MSNIVELTPAAIRHIQSQIHAANVKAFRLSVKHTGCNGYMYVPDVVETGQPDDVCFRCGELTVYVAQDAVDKIKGTKIDFVHKDLGASVLEYHNPNASGLCGCGESFNLDDE